MADMADMATLGENAGRGWYTSAQMQQAFSDRFQSNKATNI
jgi:hypothetical protein